MKYKVGSFLLAFLMLFTQTALLYAQDHPITVTATVPANATDAEVGITNSPNDSVTLYEEDEVTYTLRYRVNEAGSYPFTLQASWTKGLIENTSTLMDAMDYVFGSAQNTDDGTPAVVDLQNRTITWDMPSVSDSLTYHTVTFKLKVRSDISTESRLTVNTTVNGTIVSASVMPHTVQNIIQGPIQPTPTSTPSLSPTAEPTNIPIPGPSATPGPGPTATPTTVQKPTSSPTPVPTGPLKITEVQVTELTDTTAEVFFKTSSDTKYTVSYGTDLRKLDNSVTNTNFLSRHTFKLSDLSPNTKYFFRIKAQDAKNRSVSSDIFTFTTASINESMMIDATNTTIYSSKVPLTSPDIKTVVVPKGKYIKVNINFSRPEILSYIRAEFRKADVLGESSDSNNFTAHSNFVETVPGVLTAEIKVPDIADKYQLMFFIKTTYGTILNKPAPFDFYVSEPFKIVNASTNEAVEGASLRISKYQPGDMINKPLEEALAINNETDYLGYMNLILPQGRYIIETTAIGYETKKTTIDLGSKDLQYPTIALTTAYSLGSTIKYIQSAINHQFKFLKTNLSFSSVSFYTFSTILVLLCIFQLFALIVYLINRKAVFFLSFKKWVSQILYICFMIILWSSELLFFIIYTSTMSIRYSFPYFIIFALNSYLLASILRTFWIEYKNEDKHDL